MNIMGKCEKCICASVAKTKSKKKKVSLGYGPQCQPKKFIAILATK